MFSKILLICFTCCFILLGCASKQNKTVWEKTTITNNENTLKSDSKECKLYAKKQAGTYPQPPHSFHCKMELIAGCEMVNEHNTNANILTQNLWKQTYESSMKSCMIEKGYVEVKTL